MNKQIKKRHAVAIACLCLAIGLPAQNLAPHNNDSIAPQQQIIKASEYMIPKRAGAEKFDSNKGTEHLFISTSAGMGYLPDIGSGHEAHGPKASLYVGNWMTPVIGIRGGIDYGMWREDIATNQLGVSADYLINISAFAARYNPRRLFEAVGILGVSYQATWMPKQKVIHSYGIHGGIQAKFNVSPAFNLFIEPQLALYPDRIDNRYSWRGYDLVPSFMVGIAYKPSGFSQSRLLRNGFASLAVGIGNTGDLLFNTEFALGKWIGDSKINGIRISTGSSTAFLENEDGKGKRNSNVNISADYLCNLTRLFADHKNRIFDLVIAGGIGTYFPGGDSSASVILNGRIGFQGQIRLSEHVGFWAEPRINIFKDKSYRADLSHPIRGTIGVMTGISYKL